MAPFSSDGTNGDTGSDRDGAASAPWLVGPYRVLERLGSGGMGVVYRAHDTRLDRTVALKFLPAHVGASEAAKERFLVEARAVAALDHPHICTIHDIGEMDDGALYIAMACYDGETLEERLAGGAVSAVAALRLTLQILAGLGQAHARGIVHRDIKPANVMVTDDGVVKLLDFGIAKLADVSLTATSERLGTAAYMSPEQIRGEAVDARSDVWSVGVVLYEMLSGRHPFAGGVREVILHRVLTAEPAPLHHLRPALPKALDRIIVRALARQPSDRYASAGEMARDVERVLATLPDDEGHPPRGRRGPAAFHASATSRPLRRAVLAAPIAFLAIAAVLWAVRSPAGSGAPGPADPLASMAADAHRSLAVLPFAVGGGSEHAYLGEGLVDLLSRSLDGVGDVRVLDPATVLHNVAGVSGQGALDDALARKVARRMGAELVVLGSVHRTGGLMRIHARLLPTEESGGDVVVAQAEGDTLRLFDLVDSLSTQLLAGHGARPFSADVVRNAARITTSLPALKAFLTAEHDLRAARFEPAFEGFERAVAEDSTFALAWYRMTLAKMWATPRIPLNDGPLNRAIALSNRLHVRDRRLLDALAAFIKGAPADAEQRYRAFLTEYPDDLEALYQLGTLLFRHNPLVGRPPEEARPLFMRVLAVDPEFLCPI